ncbi:MAG: CTP synthase C-terminal region-related (seleno)protein [Fimbriimonas sp.]
MPQSIRIGLIGDRDDAVPAHRAIPLALALSAATLDREVEGVWVPTETIVDETAVASFDGLWCVPASPYRSMEGALTAIRFARENSRPFLGTCGGFQHAVIEFARHVLGWPDAEHGETAPEATRAVISPLACSLVEATNTVRLGLGSRLAQAYGTVEATEGYRCRYGLNPTFQDALTQGPMRATAWDEAGEVRGIELDGHPYFVATLFQPERAALAGNRAPVVDAFLTAAGGSTGDGKQD